MKQYCIYKTHYKHRLYQVDKKVKILTKEKQYYHITCEVIKKITKELQGLLER